MRKCALGWVVAACLLAMVCSPAGATITTSSWTPIYQGVDFATGSASASDPGGIQNIDAVRISLNTSGVSFYSTPHSFKYTPINVETFSQTTSQFVTTSGVQVAVNANFFGPCCNAVSEAKDLLGLAISQGNLVSPAQTDSTQVGAVALLITASNQASIVTTTNSTNLSNVYTAIAGSNIVLQNGVNIGGSATITPSFSSSVARTAVGISQDGSYLYLIAINGAQPGFANGATTTQEADWLSRFGAYNGMNLDGGGSTTMVRSDGSGGATLLNSPSGGAERYVGNNFGVFANPLPEPAGITLLSLAGFAAIGRRRRCR